MTTHATREHPPAEAIPNMSTAELATYLVPEAEFLAGGDQRRITPAFRAGVLEVIDRARRAEERLARIRRAAG